MSEDLVKTKKGLGSKLLSAEFLTGLLFVGALIILFYFTALVRGKDLFFSGREYMIKAKFPSAGTLSVNDKVRVIGVDMGRVKAMSLSGENNAVFVELLLRKEIQLYNDYQISIQNASVFGGGYVNIFPGSSKAGLLPMDQTFIGKPPIDIIYEASGLIAALRDDEQDLRKTIIDAKFFDKIANSAQSLSDNTKEFNAVWAELRAGKGTIGKLFADDELYKELKTSFKNLGDASARIDSLMAELQAGKGSLGKLFKDEQAYNSLVSSLDNLKDIMDKVAKGDGTFGRFVNDKGELYSSISNSMKAAEDIAVEIKNGKGTVGMLVKDDALYLELKETVRQFRAAVEDFRETSPIATFGSMLLGAL